MRPSSVHLSVTLSPLNHWVEFNQTCYITFLHGKGVREQHNLSVRPSVRPSVRLSSLHLSVKLSPSKQLGGIQPKLATLHPAMVRVYESNIIFPCVRRPTICPSHYLLLNHWAELNQTCFITSSHGKDVREQHYFSVRPSVHPASVHLSVTQSPPKPLSGI